MSGGDPLPFGIVGKGQQSCGSDFFYYERERERKRVIYLKLDKHVFSFFSSSPILCIVNMNPQIIFSSNPTYSLILVHGYELLLVIVRMSGQQLC